ncbi:MAG: ATP-binding protein [Mangrovibacterium sp.]
MFERSAIRDLRNWANKKNRKPLIVRGARQVGKTSLIDEFGKEFDLYLSLNLEKKPDLEFFLTEAPVSQIFESILVSRRLQKPRGKVLLFIDEIQNSSFAIKSLRYFFEEIPEIYVIAAGSLLETLLYRQVSFPVGRVEYLALRPCTFSEFLGALGELPLQEKLNTVSVPELLHSRTMELFKQYTLIGGMPEVVDHFADEKDVIALDSIYQTLLTGYMDDVEKYAPKETIANIIRHVIKYGWEFAARRITFEKFANSNYKSRDMAETLRTLEKTLLLELVYPTTETKLPVITILR